MCRLRSTVTFSTCLTPGLGGGGKVTVANGQAQARFDIQDTKTFSYNLRVDGRYNLGQQNYVCANLSKRRQEMYSLRNQRGTTHHVARLAVGVQGTGPLVQRRVSPDGTCGSVDENADARFDSRFRTGYQDGRDELLVGRCIREKLHQQLRRGNICRNVKSQALEHLIHGTGVRILGCAHGFNPIS